MTAAGHPRPGVLALQGAVEPHVACFRALGADCVEVRDAGALRDVTHLVLPGGESTTIARLSALFGLDAAILEGYRAGRLALFGVCAGAILTGVDDGVRPRRWGLLDARFERNAYGTQLSSTRRRVELTPSARAGGSASFVGAFIRAPRIVAFGADVRVLGSSNGEPVLVEGPRILAATFHPELSGELRVHRRLLAL